jgi:hypothetical protein
MSLILDRSKAIRGGKIEIKTGSCLGPDEFLHVSAGGYIHIDDVVALIEYVLTNTDLMPDDPRPKLIEQIRAMRVCLGYNIVDNPNSRRLVVRHD